MNSKKMFFISFTFILSLIIYLSLGNFCLSAYPKLISTLKTAFEKIYTYLIALATPAAAVAVGAGLFMRKFSFGDEEKIRTGKNLIKGSLFSYGFILLVDVVLSLIEGLLG